MPIQSTSSIKFVNVRQSNRPLCSQRRTNEEVNIFPLNSQSGHLLKKIGMIGETQNGNLLKKIGMIGPRGLDRLKL